MLCRLAIHLRPGIFAPHETKFSKAPFRSGISGICRPDGAGGFNKIVSQDAPWNVSLLAVANNGGEHSMKFMVARASRLLHRATRPMQLSSHFLATGKQFVPIAMERSTQTRGDWQAWIVFARFNAPKITGTHANILGQFFLSQIPSRPQTRHISPEMFSEWTDIGLARGHRVMLAKAKKTKQEALHPVVFSCKLAA